MAETLCVTKSASAFRHIIQLDCGFMLSISPALCQLSFFLQGHIIHIDFGFMLSNSPGGVNFEAAPFKLTRELLEVMDSTSEGKASELFDYFKVGLRNCCMHQCALLAGT